MVKSGKPRRPIHSGDDGAAFSHYQDRFGSLIYKGRGHPLGFEFPKTATRNRDSHFVVAHIVVSVEIRRHECEHLSPNTALPAARY
jgi:hypothetical protein